MSTIYSMGDPLNYTCSMWRCLYRMHGINPETVCKTWDLLLG